MASNQRTPVVPTRVGRTQDGSVDPTSVIGGVLIRLPQIEEPDAAPGVVQRLATLARSGSLTNRLTRLSPADVLRQMGSTATNLLQTRPKLVAGTTFFLIVQFALIQLWRGDKAPPEESYPAPVVELAEVLSAPPEIITGTPVTETPAWTPSFATLAEPITKAPASKNQLEPAPPQFAPSQFTGAPPLMPPSYDAAGLPQPPAHEAWGAPLERVARMPNASTAPRGPIVPPPAPTSNEGVARFEGGILPPPAGSQR